MNLGEPIAKGNTAAIYLCRGKAVKVFDGGATDEAAAREADKQRYAYALGLPVPRVHGVTRINGNPAIVMEHAAGRSLGELILEDASKAERYMALSVDVQLKIHALEAPGLEPVGDRLRRQIASAPLLSDGQRNALLQKLRAMARGSRLCHGDFHVFNLILDGEQMTILDWVDAGAGDARADACRSYLLYAQFSMEAADLYLGLYCGRSGIPPGEILSWLPVAAGARLSENVPSESAGRLIEIVNRHCPA